MCADIINFTLTTSRERDFFIHSSAFDPIFFVLQTTVWNKLKKLQQLTNKTVSICIFSFGGFKFRKCVYKFIWPESCTEFNYTLKASHNQKTKNRRKYFWVCQNTTFCACSFGSSYITEGVATANRFFTYYRYYPIFYLGRTQIKWPRLSPPCGYTVYPSLSYQGIHTEIS